MSSNNELIIIITEFQLMFQDDLFDTFFILF